MTTNKANGGANSPPDRVRELFEKAIELPAEKRTQFLMQECRGDEPLRVRVDELLNADGLDAGLLDAGLPSPESIGFEPGTELGPYRIMRQVAEGGVGVVYEAHRDTKIEDRVAIKVIKPGMDSEAVLARFRLESEALAQMNHPAIARMIDVGLTNQGHPYFAMEFVDGSPITIVCRDCDLSLSDRLRLFITICDAVQHAHLKGVIHRDLKPSNVLVREGSSGLQPMLIDFGVARALTENGETRDILTYTGQLVGTLVYMSPEQASGSAASIDARSDLFALGVLLYELLTGETPFGNIASNGSAEALRIAISESTPEWPSDRARRLGKSSDATPGTGRIQGGIPRDLDWIILRCLEKDPARRYQSASELSADLNRFLRDEPVLAARWTLWYRVRKLVTRHRTAAAIGLSLAALVIAGLTIFGLQQQRVRQADRMQAAAFRFVEMMLANADPWQAPGQRTFAEIVDAAVPRIESEMSEEPLAEAAVRHAIGRAFVAQNRDSDAVDQLKRALEIRSQALGRSDIATLDTLIALGVAIRNGASYRSTMGKPGDHVGDAERAEELLREGYESLRRKLGASDPRTIWAASEHAACLRLLSRDQDALSVLNGIINAFPEELVDRAANYPHVALSLAELEWDVQGAMSAQKMLEEFIPEYRSVLGDDHPWTYNALRLYAALVRITGGVVEALPWYSLVNEIGLRALGPTNELLLNNLNTEAYLLFELEQFEEASRRFRNVFEMKEKALGPLHTDTLVSLNNLSHLTLRSGDLSAATALSELLIERCRLSPKLEPEWLGVYLWRHADHLIRSGDDASAQPLLIESFDLLQSANPPKAARSARYLADLFTRSRDVDAADRWRHQANLLEPAPDK